MNQSSKNALPEIPWKHKWSVDLLSKGAQTLELVPSDKESEALASFLDIESLTALKCALKIRRPDGQHTIHVHGRITAEITQECTHSLELIPSSIDEVFDAYFADRDEAVPFSKAKKELFSKYGIEDMPILEEEEDPEPIIDGRIDLGECIVQFLSLAIDPYPQIEGTESHFQQEETQTAPERENPFAALKDWNKSED